MVIPARKSRYSAPKTSFDSGVSGKQLSYRNMEPKQLQQLTQISSFCRPRALKNSLMGSSETPVRHATSSQSTPFASSPMVRDAIYALSSLNDCFLIFLHFLSLLRASVCGVHRCKLQARYVTDRVVRWCRSTKDQARDFDRVPRSLRIRSWDCTTVRPPPGPSSRIR